MVGQKLEAYAPSSGVSICFAASNLNPSTPESIYSFNNERTLSWTCELSNPVIAEIISDTYEQDPAPEGMVGVGGTQSFVFDCKQTGLTDLTFTYRRPGEDGEIAEIRYAQLLVDENLQGEFRFFER